MNYFKDKILPLLIGTALSALAAILLSILSDFMPAIMPAITALPAKFYLKLIFLLVFLLAIIFILLLILFIKSKDNKPRVLEGRYSGLHWTAEIKYDGSNLRRDISAEIHWLCPKHKIFLGLKDANVPKCSYHNLFCIKCNKSYELNSGNAIVYLEEAERLITQEILNKIRIRNV